MTYLEAHNFLGKKEKKIFLFILFFTIYVVNLTL